MNNQHEKMKELGNVPESECRELRTPRRSELHGIAERL